MRGQMPRRTKADPLAAAIGARIRQLREEAGLTLEKLAYESDVDSKGHLSSLEKGLVRPTVHTLKRIADRLGVLVADLMNTADATDRERLIELSRQMRGEDVKTLVRQAERLAAVKRAPQK